MKFILKWLVPMLVIMLLFTAVIPLTVSAANNISVFVGAFMRMSIAADKLHKRAYCLV
jgi:hypothetical protein